MEMDLSKELTANAELEPQGSTTAQKDEAMAGAAEGMGAKALAEAKAAVAEIEKQELAFAKTRAGFAAKAKGAEAFLKKATAEMNLAKKEIALSTILERKAKTDPAGSAAAAKDLAAAEAAKLTGAHALEKAKEEVVEAMPTDGGSSAGKEKKPGVPVIAENVITPELPALTTADALAKEVRARFAPTKDIPGFQSSSRTSQPNTLSEKKKTMTVSTPGIWPYTKEVPIPEQKESQSLNGTIKSQSLNGTIPA